MAKILIGIPVLNNLEITRACLLSIIENTHIKQLKLEVTILVIDNGSSCDIPSMLNNDLPESTFSIYYKRNPHNMGVAVAWNQILRFSPENIPSQEFHYDFYVISNNDALVGPDWLQPMVNTMQSNSKIGWVATLENGSPVHENLIEAHTRSKKYRVDPSKPFTTEEILKSMQSIYSKWNTHNDFCEEIKESGLPLFMPFKGAGRSAVCFMIRPAMVRQIGYFDEDFWPIGISEDLEYFLRVEQLIRPTFLTEKRYPEKDKWLTGFCCKSIVHHNWCSTHQGVDFDGRKWDKAREKNWKKKFKRSKKYFTKLFT